MKDVEGLVAEVIGTLLLMAGLVLVAVVMSMVFR